MIPTICAASFSTRSPRSTAAQVVTAALLQMEKTGKGQYLPISMLESALYYNWPDVMWSRTLLGEGITHAGELADYFPTFKAKDGHISIVLVADEALELLSIWCGAELHLDTRYGTLPDRLANASEFKKAVEAMLANLTTEEICENLDAFGVPVARVNSLDEVHEDVQVQHAESLIETSHPVIGPMRFPRPPFRFAGQEFETETFPKRHAPFLGDHTREILNELRIDDSTIERLEQRDAKNRELMKAAITQAAAPANT